MSKGAGPYSLTSPFAIETARALFSSWHHEAMILPPWITLTQRSLEGNGMGHPIQPLNPVFTFAIIMSVPLLLGVMVWVTMEWFDS